MHQVEHEPTETLHIYLEREQPPHPSLLPIFLSVLALSVFVTFGALSPNQQPVTRDEIRVPAVPLTTKTFTTSIKVVPTGVKTYPATTAHGTLTITNGSIIAATIPAGFVIGNVATDRAVYVPPGNASGYGYAIVPAHATTAGKQGNIPALAINDVEGASLFIRNLSAFTGGKDSYAVKFVTAKDRHSALLQARAILLSKSSGLHYPCSEDHGAGARNMIVTWRCRFVSYTIPVFYHVTQARITGKSLLLDV